MHNLCLNTTFKISTVPFKRIQTNRYISKISRIECTGHTVVVAMFAIPFKRIDSSKLKSLILLSAVIAVLIFLV